MQRSCPLLPPMRTLPFSGYDTCAYAKGDRTMYLRNDKL